jgi:hypothetical protein
MELLIVNPSNPRRSTYGRRRAQRNQKQRGEEMALVRRRRRNGTKSGAKRKTARRAYMRSNGTKAGAKRKTARRAYKRKNPQTAATQIAASLSPGYKKQFKALRAKGVSTTAAFAAVEKTRKRRSKKRGKSKAKKTTKRTTTKRKTTKRATARKKPWVKRARKIAKKAVKRTKVRKKVAGGRGKRAIASAALTARAANRRYGAGKMTKSTAKFLKATGLSVRRNPSFAGTMGDLKTLAPTILATGASVIGMSVIGMKASAMIAPKIMGAPAIIRNNILPITTGVLTAAAWAALKSSKMSKYSMPILLGGMSAALLQLLMTSKIGQTIAAKVGYPVKLADASDITENSSADQIDAASKTEELKGLGAYAPEWGLGSYVPVSQYMGSYVDAGPQEAFGEYMASNYPVHSPGPGDNASVHGKIIADQTIAGLGGLGDYDYTTQDSGIYDNRIPSVENSLLNTPGGTIITGGEFSDNTASGEMLGVLAGSDRW